MSTLLYLDLFSGASGDMLLGALLDAGLLLDDLQAELRKMALSGYELQAERQVSHGLSGTKLRVRDVAQAYPARHLRDVRSLIEEIYRVHGRLDGVIHGAGVIEDKLIVDKTPDSFDRVVDTKADGVFILSRALRPDSLRFLVLFASAAGRFGNRGQCDYAAGNEVMNKLAEYLNQRWPGRVVAINWGPWLKRGMVSPELQRQFDKRGIQLIPIPTGRRMLARELRYGRKDELEVVVAGGDLTVRGGASDAAIGDKHGFANHLPLKYRIPYVRLLDATGGSVRTFEQIGRTYIPINRGTYTTGEVHSSSSMV